ncbi:hypothetical protein ACFY4C_20835 [Actinomadura viridis]|uniref:hypothetical protein n=1 Tax=Actinomadura viridis TaxID=58110 RepID=UPI00369B0F92
MADFDFPADLIDLQRAFYAADRRCEEIGASWPRPTAVAAGVEEISEEQHAELSRARAERLEIVERMAAHPWWDTVDRLKAKAALRKAAQA